jgi:nucleoid-associated protein EbfC
MFENFNMGDMGKMLEEMQKKAADVEKASQSKVFTAKSGGGLIEVSMNGKGEMIDLNIDDTLLEDKESLQILLMSSITDLFKMLEDDKKSQAMNMMGGLNPFGSN